MQRWRPTPVLTSCTSDAGCGDGSSRQEKPHFHFMASRGRTGFTYARMAFRKPLVAVFALCGGILLLACLNLASLLMARGAARERELATRLAMGATRRRLVAAIAGGELADCGDGDGDGTGGFAAGEPVRWRRCC